MTTLNPYLNFMGATRAAMEFYHAVFGGNLTMQTYGESGQSKKPEEMQLVMHSVLTTDHFTLMAADGNSVYTVTMGDNVALSIAGEDETLLRGYFTGLSDGAAVSVPLGKMFWGDTFGMLTDKFGIRWMINITAPKGKNP